MCVLIWVGMLRVLLFFYAQMLELAGLFICGMVSTLLQLSPGLCEAGEGSSPAGVTAQRRPRGLARSAVRSKLVLDAGLSVVAPSIDALVLLVTLLFILVAGGLDLLILLEVRPHCSG
jgi:hypothetical protein